MARDRLGTDELEGALGLLDEAPQAPSLSLAEAPVPAAPPPLKSTEARRESSTRSSGLFDSVRVAGEEEISRAASDEKIAILRRKVVALENRLQEIREAWTALEADLTEARQGTQRERQLREDAEANVTKLNTFLQQKKSEIEAYHERVQETLREQARREHEAAQQHTRREQELQQEQVRREQELQQEQVRREQELRREHGRREQELQQEQVRREQELQQEHGRREQELTGKLQDVAQSHARRERELSDELARRENETLNERSRSKEAALQSHTRREQELQQRAERAERDAREALERVKMVPPPAPPAVSLADIDEITQAVSTVGRSISAILKGQLQQDELQNVLREALRVLKSGHSLLASVSRDMRDARPPEC